MQRARIILAIAIAATAAIVVLLAPHAAMAQQDERVGVRLEVPQQMYVGDPQALQIVISGTTDTEPPDLSGLMDFKVRYSGVQSSISGGMSITINGRSLTTTIAHVYTITPLRTGQFEIPAIKVVAAGRTYLTKPVTVQVIEPKQATDCPLEIAAAPSEAYVGQPIMVTFRWTLGDSARRVSQVSFSMPVEGADCEVLSGPMSSQFNLNDRRLVQVPLNGERALAMRENDSVVLDRVIIPKAPGVIKIGAARADFLVGVGERQRSVMDFPFDNRTIFERRYSAAPEIDVKISSVPAQGRPANFSGLVGAYAINATADTTNVAVGDPINLSLTVMGPYPLSLVPPIDLTTQSSLKSGFRLPREPALGQTTPTAATFQTMIRARSPEVKEIGPVSLTYFDPADKSYKVAQTRPIPLIVHGAANVTLPDEPETAQQAPKELVRRPGGLPDIDRAPLAAGMGGAGPLEPRAKLHSPATLAILILPPAACILIACTVALARWRERDPAARRRRAAYSALRRELHRAPPGALDPIARALSNFAADSFDQPRDTVTGARAAELLAQTKTPAGAELASLIESYDESRFGMAGFDGADSASDSSRTEQALNAAHRFIRQLRERRRVTA